MIGKTTDGSTAVANEEISSRNENKKRKRRKTCDINHHEVPKDTFSPETCTLTSDMPSRYPALDLVMSQYQEENQGKDPNMVEKATDGSSAMTSVEVNSRKKNKEGRRREKTRHDSLQSNVNLSGVSKGDISHLTLVSKHDHSKASHFSIGRATSSCPKKKLLVLDLNGLLADFVLGVPKGYKPDKKIHNKAVFKRPFCDDFLQFCFDKFHVGIWSSRKRQNVDAAIKLLVGVSESKLLFAWDQRHCTKTKFQTIEDKHKPLMLKELSMLWEKSRPGLPWEKGEFNETNTLLLDDSPYKAIRNPMHTAIFPYSYRYNDTNDSSLGPGGDLRVYLEGLAMAENVPQYVASHPFGQPPITKSNPHWDFYCEVRDPGLVAKRPTKKRYRHISRSIFSLLSLSHSLRLHYPPPPPPPLTHPRLWSVKSMRRHRAPIGTNATTANNATFLAFNSNQVGFGLKADQYHNEGHHHHSGKKNNVLSLDLDLNLPAPEDDHQSETSSFPFEPKKQQASLNSDLILHDGKQDLSVKKEESSAGGGGGGGSGGGGETAPATAGLD
ncbi:hypothetical protein K1719_029842 [Acacia pycnantha]|nr:hypothetical protein K1719_029842 [Acacia pycnantha]